MDRCFIEKVTIGQKKGMAHGKRGMALQEKGMAQRHSKMAWGKHYTQQKQKLVMDTLNKIGIKHFI